MSVKCTGLVTVVENIVSGIGTIFETELCIGDKVSINNGQYLAYVISILADTTLVISANISINTSSEISIEDANPGPRLNSKKVSMCSNGPIATGSYMSSSFPYLLGGQCFNKVDKIALATLSYSDLTGNGIIGACLPSGYDYTCPYENLTLGKTNIDSTIVEVPSLDIYVSSSLNSNSVRVVQGSASYLVPNLTIEINSIGYKIMYKYGETYYPYNTIIVLDKVVNVTSSKILLKIPNNYNELFPKYSTILLNGKLYSVLESNINSIQLKYPIDQEAIVTLRKPLLGTQVGKNSIIFSNITIPKEYLIPHNVIAIQETRGENILDVAQIQYTEAKLIARNFDSHIVTYDENIRSYTGIVCFGVPSNGLSYISGGTANSMNSINIVKSIGSYPITNNTIIVIDKLLYKIVSSYIGTDYFTYSVSPPLPALGNYDVYVLDNISYFSDYSQIIRKLCLKFAEHTINTGIKSVISLSNLYSLYLSTFLFSITYFAKEHTVYSNYDPILLSTDFLAEPPTKVEFNFAISYNCASDIYQYENRIIRRCGLYLRSGA